MPERSHEVPPLCEKVNFSIREKKLYTKVAKTNGRKDSYLKIIRKKIFLLILLLSNLKLQKLWSYIYSATMENVLNIRTQYSAGSASSRRS